MNTTRVALSNDLNRLSGQANRETPTWSVKFPVSITALLAPAALAEPTQVDDMERRLKAAASKSFQLGGED